MGGQRQRPCALKTFIKVPKWVSFGTNSQTNRIKASSVSELCPESTADANYLTLGILFRADPKTLSQKLPFTIGGSRREAVDFVVHVELGGVTGVIAPIIGKQPTDYHTWILGGSSPAFIREEGQLYEAAPSGASNKSARAFATDLRRTSAIKMMEMILPRSQPSPGAITSSARSELGLLTMASIVVIDSEETVRRVMTEILQNGGHSVRGAREFDDGISLLRSDLPDLVITNVFLRGGITGHEAMRKLKGEFPQLPFLMVSGLPDETGFS